MPHHESMTDSAFISCSRCTHMHLDFGILTPDPRRNAMRGGTLEVGRTLGGPRAEEADGLH